MFENSGLDINKISILLLVWSITSFILEIPSGVFADKYDRRTILILAQLIRVAGYLIWLIFPTFLGFLVGFLFWGVKSAFTSGTLEAYLYDGLNHINQEKYYSKALGSLKSLSFIAILIASILASVLFPFGYSVILILSVLALLISLFALITLKSIKIIKSSSEIKYFSILVEGLNHIVENRQLLIFVLVSSVVVGVMAIDEYFALYINYSHISPRLVGYLFALYSLLQIFGSFIAYKFESHKYQLIFLFLVNISLLIIGLLFGYIGVLIFMLLALFSSIGQVISNSAIQKSTKNHIRATVTSVSGFFAEIIAFCAYIVFWLVPSNDLQVSFLVYGVFILIITIIIITISIANRNKLFSNAIIFKND